MRKRYCICLLMLGLSAVAGDDDAYEVESGLKLPRGVLSVSDAEGADDVFGPETPPVFGKLSSAAFTQRTKPLDEKSAAAKSAPQQGAGQKLRCQSTTGAQLLAPRCSSKASKRFNGKGRSLSLPYGVCFGISDENIPRKSKPAYGPLTTEVVEDLTVERLLLQGLDVGGEIYHSRQYGRVISVISDAGKGFNDDWKEKALALHVAGFGEELESITIVDYKPPYDFSACIQKEKAAGFYPNVKTVRIITFSHLGADSCDMSGDV